MYKFNTYVLQSLIHLPVLLQELCRSLEFFVFLEQRTKIYVPYFMNISNCKGMITHGLLAEFWVTSKCLRVTSSVYWGFVLFMSRITRHWSFFIYFLFYIGKVTRVKEQEYFLCKLSTQLYPQQTTHHSGNVVHV